MLDSKLLQQSDKLLDITRSLRSLQPEIAKTLECLEASLGVKETLWKKPAVTQSGDIGYTLFGQTFPAKDGNDIFVGILRHFAEFDEMFPERYQKAVSKIGRKRCYVARTPHEVYPGKKNLIRSATQQIAPGWFVGTNENNAKKLKLLRKACDVLKLEWGKDLKVQMPKARSAMESYK